MGAMQRRKGAVGERELADLLTELSGIKAERTAQRCGKGGTADLRWIPGVHVEAKRYARAGCTAWLEQAEADATHTDIPLVCVRVDGARRWLALCDVRDLFALADRIADAVRNADAARERGHG